MSNVDDFALFVRDRNRKIVARVADGDFSGEFTDLMNSVGGWTITVLESSPSTVHLATPGSGIVFNYRGRTFLSGPTTSYERSTNEDGESVYVVEGVSDMVIFEDRLLSIAPEHGGGATTEYQWKTVGPNDEYSVGGALGDVIAHIIHDQLGPGAAPGRRVDGLRVINNMRSWYSGGRSWAGFETVLEGIREVCGITGRVSAVQSGGEIMVSLDEIDEQTGSILLSTANGTLTESRMKIVAPTANTLWVGGLTYSGGERKWVGVGTTTLSQEAKSEWNRHIEIYNTLQANQTEGNNPPSWARWRVHTEETFDVGTEDYLGGVEMEIVPSADSGVLESWGVGSSVTVDTGEWRDEVLVSGAVVQVSDGAVKIGVTVGSLGAFHPEVSESSRISKLERGFAYIRGNMTKSPVNPFFNADLSTLQGNIPQEQWSGLRFANDSTYQGTDFIHVISGSNPGVSWFRALVDGTYDIYAQIMFEGGGDKTVGLNLYHSSGGVGKNLVTSYELMRSSQPTNVQIKRVVTLLTGDYLYLRASYWGGPASTSLSKVAGHSYICGFRV